MDRCQLLTAAVVAAVAAATPATARAQEGSDQDIVGSWSGTITATNPPLGQFNDLISFHTGGVVTESRRYLVTPTPIGDLLETTAHGAWKRTGGHTFEAFLFIFQNAGTGAAQADDAVKARLRTGEETINHAYRALRRKTHADERESAYERAQAIASSRRSGCRRAMIGMVTQVCVDDSLGLLGNVAGNTVGGVTGVPLYAHAMGRVRHVPPPMEYPRQDLRGAAMPA
jgi:hypothetical protein